MLLRVGAAGKASIKIRGKGFHLPLPSMPLALPLTVQLTNSETGVCWEARYTSASRNDAQQLKAASE